MAQAVEWAKFKESIVKASVTQRNEEFVASWGKSHAYTDTCTKAHTIHTNKHCVQIYGKESKTWLTNILWAISKKKKTKTNKPTHQTNIQKPLP